MTKEELLDLYIEQITNYGNTYEEFKTIAVNQNPNFPGIAEILNEDLYSYEEFLNAPEIETQTESQPTTSSQPTIEAQNDNSTINTTATNSIY